MSYTNITARVSLLRKLASKEFIEFCTEYTIGDELALLADLRGGHFCVDGAAERQSQLSIRFVSTQSIQFHRIPVNMHSTTLSCMDPNDPLGNTRPKKTHFMRLEGVVRGRRLSTLKVIL